MPLLLTRQIGETINIGDDIEVTVTKFGSNFVTLAVTAPKDVSVHREEVYRRIQNDNTQSKN